jgi:eukaryotic-like serine/threonine-protein kinase
MANLIGQTLGRYQILEQLGKGGMATVYKAYDSRLEAHVAVKVIRTERLSPEITERALKRFEREAKSLAQLNHPNIVKVTDFGEFEGQPYLVMPYLEGGSLKELIESRGVIPWQEAIRFILPIAHALDYAHQRNTIHRDVKPSNILITDSGEPVLTDFGVAKIIDEESTLDLTGTGATLGTPAYMAPEQVISKTVDYRADIYSLGVVIYEMVTGRKPFQADTPMAVLFKHASEPLPRPTEFVPELPDRVEQVLIKALAKKPDDRYPDMAAFANALNGLQNTTPLPPHPSFSTSREKMGERTTQPSPIKREHPATSPSMKPARPPASPPASAVEQPTPRAGWDGSIPKGLIYAAIIIGVLLVGLVAVLLVMGPLHGVIFPPTVTPTATATSTLTPTFTYTSTFTATYTSTPTSTVTPSPTIMPSPTPTNTKAPPTYTPAPPPTDTNVPRPPEQQPSDTPAPPPP